MEVMEGKPQKSTARLSFPEKFVASAQKSSLQLELAMMRNALDAVPSSLTEMDVLWFDRSVLVA